MPSGKSLRKLRILLAPLDWGLGHATRCIPVVYELLRQDYDVWLAGEGAQEVLLKAEFPDLPFLSLPGYRVRYSRTALGLAWKMIRQSRLILEAIREERDWLEKAVARYGFDAVISDSRFGLTHPDIPCVFISHQLRIRVPYMKWLEDYIQRRNYGYIDRFTECWVPDEAGQENLAGRLSHPFKIPRIPTKYIGVLSRLKRAESPGKVEKGRLLILLSGPEPQRTLLENKIIRDIAHYPGTATIVRGVPGNLNMIPSSNQIRFYNHLPASELNVEYDRAELVISRSGYSTIMDIVQLGKKSVLVPTPGQTEQAYLARHLQARQVACYVEQRGFTLSNAIAKADAFSYTEARLSNSDGLREAMTEFTQKLCGD
jgi:UDP:flavonoid glycosyltransferase YjiC (YdhE family)